MIRTIAILGLALAAGLYSGQAAFGWQTPDSAKPSQYFAIEVVDQDTGRGVPMVELTTTSSLRFFTDSNGIVAFDEPGLMNQRVYFGVKSHGYEYAKDGFGFRGKALDVKPGGKATLKIKRLNIAERMYRITGQGIYADSVRIGRKTPIKQPLLNAKVTGQDSTLATVYRGRIYWFWGDTNRPRYALGHFGTSAATSKLPEDGGLDPALGIDLKYFVDKNGFSKPMFKLGKPGPVWIDGVLTVKDDSGIERLLCHYMRMKDLSTVLEQGLAVLNDKTQLFEPIKQLPLDEKGHPHGMAQRMRPGETDYFYFAFPYPLVRVKADWKSVTDPKQYEAFTPLVAGSRFDKANPKLDRDKTGTLMYAWKKNTESVGPQRQNQLVQAGHMKANEGWIQLRDAATGKPVLLHRGSVRWNAYRKKWILVANQQFGSRSVLGEVWYSEADAPHGPFNKAIRIVTHNKYSFYNPVHHAFLDKDRGRYIFFEGTYTHTFSGTKVPTPRYNYNQIMYRLDLADMRLRAIE